ncbi:NAD(P)/FAD-dependent oxidoreductase [Nitratireductor kimnyeongensis]|uniref:NAD(P)/FAD-dependent oxidoreductase n=1 Tax=Nitratireductor kimnyeongensis TaxID=430679 RepID=A0ABW0T5H7_9HYPH|nr:FAD-binding oxidoreductase [Nitratireductor kimnyeongensis]QZZ34418.1 FAD-binding oxidoreductase [Nitratireductor kimnyeongensis]
MSQTSDIIIIGGGIAGISAGARMAADARITVLEAEDAIGYHSTGRSAAIFIRNYGNATLRALNAASEPLFMQPKGISDNSLLTPRGLLYVALEEHLEDLEAILEGATGMERLSADQAVARVPILKRDSIAAAAVEPGAQDIDVDRLLQGFAKMLRQRGGSIVNKAPVTAISRTNGTWTLQTPQGSFSAPVVVNAGGAWADEIAKLASVQPLGLTPMRRSAVILPAPEGHDVTGWPLFACAGEGWYCKPDAGKLMVSPADEDPTEPFDAWPDDMVLAEGLHRFEQAVTVPVTRIERSWAGLRSFFPDRTPAVGFAPDAEGFFWLAGQGGYGVQTSPALSALAADLCAGRTSTLPDTVVQALAPNRLIKS